VLRATLRSLLDRKLRLLLSGVAVLLGVAFVSGTFVLTDSLGRVFDNLFADVNKGTAVQVRGADALGGSGGDSSSGEGRPPVPASVLAEVRGVGGVAEVLPTTTGFAKVFSQDGRQVGGGGGAPTFAVDFAPSARQESLVLREGAPPTQDGQVAVDAASARKSGVKVGDPVRVQFRRSGGRPFTVVGIVGFGSTDNLAGAGFAAFAPDVAQRYVGTPGTYSGLSVAAADGVSQADLRDRIARVLPTGVEAVTSASAVEQQARQVKDGLRGFSTFLLVFAGISLFVGAFLIFNTFSMLIAQRARELALLRALGASRGQVTRSVLLEAVVVGLLSSLVGLGLGLVVAVGLRALLGALGIDLPSGDTVVAPRTVIVSLVVGVGVTAVAALLPARRASRVAPVEAMRESGPAEDRSLTRRGVLGGLLTLVGVAALLTGLSGAGLPLVGLGTLLTFLGVATLSPLVARPVASALGAPFARLGVPGRLGRGNAVRSPRRTSATAAALMVGLALVSTVSVLGSSFKQSVVQAVQTSLGADYVLHTKDYSPFSDQVATQLRTGQGISAVAAFRQARARIGDGVHSVQGVEPAALQSVLKLRTVSGDLGSLGQGRLAVSSKVADSQGLAVGRSVPVTWARTGSRPLQVGAVYDVNQFAGDYLVSTSVFNDNTTSVLPSVVAVRAAAGSDPAQTRTLVDRTLTGFPDVVVEDQAQFVATQGKQVDQLLNALTVLLVLSVLIAVLGIVNTLALSVVERTRELGLLRAVGLQRRQLRRMIRVEAVIIAVYGALLGVVLGCGFGYALVRALAGQGVTEFALPVGRLVVVIVVAAVAGVLAAALPARRAARLDVLRAVSAA